MKTGKASEFVWVQRDGKPIHVRAMTDEHLLNTIRLLRRWSKRLAERFNMEAESRVWSAEDAAGEYWFDDDDFCTNHVTWPALQFERRIRGLDELPVEEEKGKQNANSEGASGVS